jgi:adhesin/invasin
MCSRNLLIPTIFLFLLGSVAGSAFGGAIYVNTNVAGIAFTITGPTNYTGIGLSWSQSNAPAGTYTITYGYAPGYTTPTPETRDLPANGSITFNGNYAMPGSTGAINVITDLAGATFRLSGAGNYIGGGTLWMQFSAPAGSYTITFAAVDGYPTPPSQTLVLAPGRTITFTGMYNAASVGAINVSTDLTTATFTLMGPTVFTGGGLFWSQSYAPAGSYTIMYGTVPGYPTPPSQTLVLTPGGSITFTASYGAAFHTGTITVSTNLTAAAFTLTGPASYTGGGAFWSHSNCPAGAYNISYAPVPGYPTPPNQTLVLTAGGVISFAATYGATLTSGTINVNTNLAGASFLLTGPASYTGNGMSWLQANAPIGTYTITFGTIAGYTTPAPQTQALAASGTITFNGIYLPSAATTGTIIVTADLPSATFTLTGPVIYHGTGALWLQSNAVPGAYTVSFGPVPGFPTPPNQVLILSAGGTITFAANYGPAPATGTIVVSTNLSAATFVLAGPAFYQGSGMLWSWSNCPPGSYTIVFGALSGYPAPPSQTLVLSPGGTITFTGNYGIAAATGTIKVTTNMATASFWLTGPASYNGGGLWWSQTGAPSGAYTISYASIAGYQTPLSQTVFLSPGSTIAFNGIYTSLTPLDLDVTPSSLSLTYELGQSLPVPQKISVSPQGGPVPLTAYPYGGATWLSVTPANTMAPTLLTVVVNPAGLTAGSYTSTIRIDAGPAYLLVSIPVTLTVREAPRLILTPAKMSFSYVIGGNLPAAQDLWVSAAVRNVSFTLNANAGTWLSMASSGTTPAKLSVTVNPINIAPGTFTGAIVISSKEISNSPQTVPVTLVITALSPQLVATAVLNAASGANLIAPCSIASIYGTELAQSVERAQRAPLPYTLGSATVTLNGRGAALFYASPTQINLQVPCDLAPGPAEMVVSNGFAYSSTTIQISLTAPGVFLYEAKWAAANNQDGTTHGDDNPAMVGSIVSVFFTGQGLLDSWIATGDAAPMDHVICPIAPVSATLGGQPVEIMFVGLSPGSVGLAQVNIRIPALRTGQYPLVLKVGDVSSNVAVICVKTITAVGLNSVE